MEIIVRMRRAWFSLTELLKMARINRGEVENADFLESSHKLPGRRIEIGFVIVIVLKLLDDIVI